MDIRKVICEICGVMSIKLTDDQMKSQISNVIDELASAGKQAIRSVFDLMVTRTADTASDLADKGVEKLKQTIDKKVENDKDKED